SFSIPNEDLSDDTTPSVSRKFLNEVKSTIVTLQRVVKQRMTIETHNWASSAHQELHKIEAAKFVEEFKSLANEADASLAKHKTLELEIERLLKAVVSQDIISIVKNASVVDTSVLQTELKQFQVLNYARENAHLKATYKNLFDSIFVSRTQTKTIIASSQNELQSTIYKNVKLRTQLFKKVSDQKDNTCDTSANTKFAKQPIVENLLNVGKTHALSKPVTSNSVSTPQESKGVNNDKVIASGMFRINPDNTSREAKKEPNTVVDPYFIRYKGCCKSRCEERCVFFKIHCSSNWFHEAHLESYTSNAQDACNADAPESSGNLNPTATSTNPLADHMETLTLESVIPTVLKNQKDKRGIVIRNKARLVAQGHTQEEGIDYEEVFAPVARIEAIRLFLAYASYMRFVVYQMDVKSAFLYGTIDEEVYVMQPLRFQDPEFPDKVYKVEKAMYGLHQAPKAWYGTLSKYLLTNGFQRGKIDQTLFIIRHREDFILVQVQMIPEPGDTNRDVPMNETFHVQTDDELIEKELKQIDTDDQAIKTILLGLPEDIYAAVDSCKTAQEIWLRV
nr:putative reverse transcriptase, RNA-dependent DNA polymerase [Tanacetum cinerariifolium]